MSKTSQLTFEEARTFAVDKGKSIRSSLIPDTVFQYLPSYNEWSRVTHATKTRKSASGALREYTVHNELHIIESDIPHQDTSTWEVVS